jgi:two-component system chemotaxis response regulator CheY
MKIKKIVVRGRVGLYTIGEISKIVNISVDTLRYYDEINLLKPVRVEESNRYRYYSKEQVSVLLFIIELKQYGFSLDAVRELIHDGVNVESSRLKLALNLRLRQLEVEKKTLQKTVLSIERRISEIEGSEQGNHPLKILVVDDAAFLRDVVTDILEKHGYLVVTAENGQQAVEKYAYAKPDMVIMDIIMPEMDGLTATKKIIEMDKDAKIIALSARNVLPVVCEILEYGATDFIIKPFQEETLLDALYKAYHENSKVVQEALYLLKREVKENDSMNVPMTQEMISKIIRETTIVLQ